MLLLAASAARAASPSTAEIDAFWRATRERLAREPMDAQLESVDEAVPYKSFRVTLRGLDGVRFRARLALPVKGEGPAERWPVIVTATGYSGRGHGVLLGECQRGYAILQVFPRGQGESAALWKQAGDKVASSVDQPEGAYYQGAYADVIRAIDFAASRDDLDVDAERIVLVGTSQGGGIALAVAALDPRVKAVVAHVPFLCDMGLVKKLLDKAGRNDERALGTLAYFDPVQLAPRLRVPVLLSAGGKDEVCPAATIQSVHDRLSGEKTLKFYPDLTHTSCVDFYNFSWNWLDRHVRGSTAAQSAREE